MHTARGRLAAALAVAPALLLACLSGEPVRVSQPAEPGAGEVALELAGPNEAALIVPVRINGEGPFPMVLDTGATFTCVDQEIAQRLQLPEAAALGFGAGVGGGGRVGMVRVETLQVGDTTAHDLLACTLDLAHLQELPGLDVDGLLGLNFLRSFEVTLDFGRNTLSLEPLAE